MFRIDLNALSLIGHTKPDVEAAGITAQCLRPEFQDQRIGRLTTFTCPCFEMRFPLVVNGFLRIVTLCLVHNHAVAPESLNIRVGKGLEGLTKPNLQKETEGIVYDEISEGCFKIR